MKKKLKLQIEVDERGVGKMGGATITGDNNWLTIKSDQRPNVDRVIEFTLKRRDFEEFAGVIKTVVESLDDFEKVIHR